MKKVSRVTVTLLIIFLCAGAVYVIRQYQDDQRKKADAQQVPGRAKGNPKADLRIIEYVDFQCPACANGSKILRKYVDQYPDQIYVEVKYFPLGGSHIHSYVSARYVECAAKQGQFWKYFEKVFSSQDQWKRLIDVKPAFNIYASDMGLDMNRLKKCVSDENVLSDIGKEKAEGQKRGVQSTPTYFINDAMYVGPASLTKVLEEKFGK